LARYVRRSPEGVGTCVAIATVVAYGAWLGWDQVKDVAPDGSTSGPYQTWQVLGLGAVLAVIGIAGGWVGRPLVTGFVSAAFMGLCFAIDGATDPPQQNDGLWTIGAFAVTLAGLLFVVPVACATAALVARLTNGAGAGAPSVV